MAHISLACLLFQLVVIASMVPPRYTLLCDSFEVNYAAGTDF